MNNNATVSYKASTSTTIYTHDTYGGGVVTSGTFTMNDNASVSGNIADSTSSSFGTSYGGGVYVLSGTFTMHNYSSISGNTATASHYIYSTNSYGGGVYVASGTFIFYGGTIYGYGNNNADRGSALDKSSGATAVYGNGSPIL
jgi:hypothetical protein